MSYVDTLIERCKAAIELAEQIGSEPIVQVNAAALDDEILVEWRGAEGTVIGEIVFDAQELLDALRGDEVEA